MPKNGAIFCSKDCADQLNVTSNSQVIFLFEFIEVASEQKCLTFVKVIRSDKKLTRIIKFQAAQQPLSQYVRHSVNFDQFEENSLSKEVSFNRYVNSHAGVVIERILINSCVKFDNVYSRFYV